MVGGHLQVLFPLATSFLCPFHSPGSNLGTETVYDRNTTTFVLTSGTGVGGVLSRHLYQYEQTGTRISRDGSVFPLIGTGQNRPYRDDFRVSIRVDSDRNSRGLYLEQLVPEPFQCKGGTGRVRDKHRNNSLYRGTLLLVLTRIYRNYFLRRICYVNTHTHTNNTQTWVPTYT